jgi:membrane peptidoglycan carboxypeptidase
MKTLLIAATALVLLSASAVVVLIGSSFQAASHSIRQSSVSNHPEQLRSAVLAAETSQQRSSATIAMQFAKDYTCRSYRPSRNIVFNIREALLSKAISIRYLPKKILSAYMDHVYMGKGIEGLPAAARFYVGRNAHDLDASECALLAGLIESPGSYSPIHHPDRAIQRRNAVLQRMLQSGAISRQTFEAATRQSIRPAA